MVKRMGNLVFIMASQSAEEAMWKEEIIAYKIIKMFELFNLCRACSKMRKPSGGGSVIEKGNCEARERKSINSLG